MNQSGFGFDHVFFLEESSLCFSSSTQFLILDVIQSTEGILFELSFEKISSSFRLISKAPVEESLFCSMLRPKYPPKKISILFSWILWQRGWSRIAGMKLPPMLTPKRPICNKDTPLLNSDLVPESGYSEPITNTSGCKKPNCSFRSLKAFQQPQLEQYWTNRVTVYHSPLVLISCC